MDYQTWKRDHGDEQADGMLNYRAAYNPDKIEERETLEAFQGGFNIFETIRAEEKRKYNKKSKYWDTRWTKTK